MIWHSRLRTIHMLQEKSWLTDLKYARQIKSEKESQQNIVQNPSWYL